jgi:hypothetical protein
MGRATAINVWDLGCDPKWTNDNTWLKTRMLDLNGLPIVNVTFPQTYNEKTGKTFTLAEIAAAKAANDRTFNQGFQMRCAAHAISLVFPGFLVSKAWSQVSLLSKVFPYAARKFAEAGTDAFDAGEKIVQSTEKFAKQVQFVDEIDEVSKLANGLRNAKIASEAADVAKSAQLAGKTLKSAGGLSKVVAKISAGLKAIGKALVALGRLMIRMIPVLQIIDIILMAVDIISAGAQIVGAQGNAEGMLNFRKDEVANTVFDYAYFKRQFELLDNSQEFQNLFLHAMTSFDDPKDLAYWEHRYDRVRTVYGNDYSKVIPDGTFPLWGGPPPLPPATPGPIIIGGGEIITPYLDKAVLTREPASPPIVTINTPGLVDGVIVSNAQGGAALDWSVSLIEGDLTGTKTTCIDVNTKQRIYFGKPKGSSPPEPIPPPPPPSNGITYVTLQTITMNLCIDTCPPPDATVFAAGKQHTIQCDAVNPSGGKGFQQLRFAVVDNTPPAINLLSRTVQAATVSGVYNLTFEAWDETSGADFRAFRATLSINNGPYRIVTLQPGNTPARRDISIALPTGLHTFYVTVEDLAGNRRFGFLPIRISQAPRIVFSGLPPALPRFIEAMQGNSAQVFWNVSVSDDEVLSPRCQWSIAEWSMDRWGPAVISNRAVSPISLVQSGRTFAALGSGLTNIINCSAVDSYGLGSWQTFSFIVRDTTPPAWLPQSLVPRVTSLDTSFFPPDTANRVAVAFLPPVATDLNLNLAQYPGGVAKCDRNSGDLFAWGHTEIICRVADLAGNLATYKMIISVVWRPQARVVPICPRSAICRDIVGRSISPPLFPSLGVNGGVFNWQVQVKDIISGPLGGWMRVDGNTVRCSVGSTLVVANETVFARGLYMMKCNYTSPWSEIVVPVNYLFKIQDLIAPTLLMQNQSFTTSLIQGSRVNYTAQAFDESGSANLTCLPANGSVFAFGTTTVRCNATDNQGNVARGTFTVTLNLVSTTTSSSSTSSSSKSTSSSSSKSTTSSTSSSQSTLTVTTSTKSTTSSTSSKSTTSSSTTSSTSTKSTSTSSTSTSSLGCGQAFDYSVAGAMSYRANPTTVFVNSNDVSAFQQVMVSTGKKCGGVPKPWIPSTGTDECGNVAPINSTEIHWQLSYPSGFSAKLAILEPFWMDSSAFWTPPYSHQLMIENASPGTYIFVYEFDGHEVNMSNIKTTFSYSSDQEGQINYVPGTYASPFNVEFTGGGTSVSGPSDMRMGEFDGTLVRHGNTIVLYTTKGTNSVAGLRFSATSFYKESTFSIKFDPPVEMSFGAGLNQTFVGCFASQRYTVTWTLFNTNGVTMGSVSQVPVDDDGVARLYSVSGLSGGIPSYQQLRVSATPNWSTNIAVNTELFDIVVADPAIFAFPASTAALRCGMDQDWMAKSINYVNDIIPYNSTSNCTDGILGKVSVQAFCAFDGNGDGYVAMEVYDGPGCQPALRLISPLYGPQYAQKVDGVFFSSFAGVGWCGITGDFACPLTNYRRVKRVVTETIQDLGVTDITEATDFTIVTEQATGTATTIEATTSATPTTQIFTKATDAYQVTFGSCSTAIVDAINPLDVYGSCQDSENGLYSIMGSCNFVTGGYDWVAYSGMGCQAELGNGTDFGLTNVWDPLVLRCQGQVGFKGRFACLPAITDVAASFTETAIIATSTFSYSEITLSGSTINLGTQTITVTDATTTSVESTYQVYGNGALAVFSDDACGGLIQAVELKSDHCVAGDNLSFLSTCLGSVDGLNAVVQLSIFRGANCQDAILEFQQQGIVWPLDGGASQVCGLSQFAGAKSWSFAGKPPCGNLSNLTSLTSSISTVSLSQVTATIQQTIITETAPLSTDSALTETTVSISYSTFTEEATSTTVSMVTESAVPWSQVYQFQCIDQPSNKCPAKASSNATVSFAIPPLQQLGCMSGVNGYSSIFASCDAYGSFSYTLYDAPSCMNGSEILSRKTQWDPQDAGEPDCLGSVGTWGTCGFYGPLPCNVTERQAQLINEAPLNQASLGLFSDPSQGSLVCFKDTECSFNVGNNVLEATAGVVPGKCLNSTLDGFSLLGSCQAGKFVYNIYQGTDCQNSVVSTGTTDWKSIMTLGKADCSPRIVNGTYSNVPDLYSDGFVPIGSCGFVGPDPCATFGDEVVGSAGQVGAFFGGVAQFVIDGAPLADNLTASIYDESDLIEQLPWNPTISGRVVLKWELNLKRTLVGVVLENVDVMIAGTSFKLVQSGVPTPLATDHANMTCGWSLAFAEKKATLVCQLIPSRLVGFLASVSVSRLDFVISVKAYVVVDELIARSLMARSGPTNVVYVVLTKEFAVLNSPVSSSLTRSTTRTRSFAPTEIGLSSKKTSRKSTVKSSSKTSSRKSSSKTSSRKSSSRSSSRKSTTMRRATTTTSTTRAPRATCQATAPKPQMVIVARDRPVSFSQAEAACKKYGLMPVKLDTAKRQISVQNWSARSRKDILAALISCGTKKVWLQDGLVEVKDSLVVGTGKIGLSPVLCGR